MGIGDWADGTSDGCIGVSVFVVGLVERVMDVLVCLCLWLGWWNE